VFALPAESAFVLAGDLNPRRADGLKLLAGGTRKIGKVGDGDEFFAVGAHIALDPDRGGLLSEGAEGFVPVSELVLSLGYIAESAFGKAFRRTTGMALKRYQPVFAGMDRLTSRRGIAEVILKPAPCRRPQRAPRR
jgi:AraC-like DNA-binding protein